MDSSRVGDNVIVGKLIELQEYLVVDSENVQMTEYKWSQNATKILIDLYGKFKKKLGTFEVRSIKMMWIKIAEALLKFNIRVTPNNCINRWRVLERNYKKYVDNQNKTGRGYKFFEYKTEMEEIFGKKRNVHPELLLSNDQIDDLVDDTNIEGDINSQEGILDQNENNLPTSTIELSIIPSKKIPLTSIKKIKQTSTTPKKVQITKKKTSVMEKMRIDRKMYFDEKLKIEMQKLEEIKKRNRLIEERNAILREQKCNCQLESIL